MIITANFERYAPRAYWHDSKFMDEPIANEVLSRYKLNKLLSAFFTWCREQRDKHCTYIVAPSAERLLPALFRSTSADGYCVPSVALLARRCRRTVRTMSRVLNDLEAVGIIKRHRRLKHNEKGEIVQTSTSYELNTAWTPEWAEQQKVKDRIPIARNRSKLVKISRLIRRVDRAMAGKSLPSPATVASPPPPASEPEPVDDGRYHAAGLVPIALEYRLMKLDAIARDASRSTDEREMATVAMQILEREVAEPGYAIRWAAGTLTGKHGPEMEALWARLLRSPLGQYVHHFSPPCVDKEEESSSQTDVPAQSLEAVDEDAEDTSGWVVHPF